MVVHNLSALVVHFPYALYTRCNLSLGSEIAVQIFLLNLCRFVITLALMMGMDETILDRIAFGGVKELEELYQQ